MRIENAIDEENRFRSLSAHKNPTEKLEVASNQLLDSSIINLEVILFRYPNFSTLNKEEN